MTSEKIRKAVENYYDLFAKQEKLQKRLISLGGKYPEQEIAILQRLQTIEQMIEFIDYAIYEEDILTIRESAAVDYRRDGFTYEKIGEIFSVTRESVRKTLESAYKKMAEVAKDQNIA
jgi:DNA-directed RNA polymerase sigma subunit (sigma70/sigma32)